MFRDFIETILIKEDFDDPKERARRAAQKRREKEEAAKKLMAASKLVSFNFFLLNFDCFYFILVWFNFICLKFVSILSS